MRPGYLAGLDEFWFSRLGGDYFDIQEARSADPVFVSRDEVYGKTADEYKADRGDITWASTLIPRDNYSEDYSRSPYWDKQNASGWKQLYARFKNRPPMFRLV